MTILSVIDQLGKITFMKLEMYQVNAFTGRLFSGKPVPVVILDSSIKDDSVYIPGSAIVFFEGTISIV